MRKNVGSLDSAIRITVGLLAVPAAVLLLGALEGSVVGLLVLAVGVIGLVTGITRRCPTYLLLGIDTLDDDDAAKAAARSSHA